MTDITDRADATDRISRRDSNQIRLASNERLESLGLVAGGVAAGVPTGGKRNHRANEL